MDGIWVGTGDASLPDGLLAYHLIDEPESLDWAAAGVPVRERCDEPPGAWEEGSHSPYSSWLDAVEDTAAGPVEWLHHLMPSAQLMGELEGLPPELIVSDADAIEMLAHWNRLEAYCALRKRLAAAELARRQSMANGLVGLKNLGKQSSNPNIAGDEIAIRVGVGRRTAATWVRSGRAFMGVGISTAVALESGELDAAKADVIVDGIEELPPTIALQVQEEVLPKASHVPSGTVRKALAKAIADADPENFEERTQRAMRTRRVDRPRVLADGMASLYALLPATEATGIYRALDAAARSAKAGGDRRTLDQLRADALALMGTTAVQTGWIGPAPAPPEAADLEADPCGCEPRQPHLTDLPEWAQQKPDAPDAPSTPGTPSAPDAPGAPGEPGAPGVSMASGERHNDTDPREPHEAGIAPPATDQVAARRQPGPTDTPPRPPHGSTPSEGVAPPAADRLVTGRQPEPTETPTRPPHRNTPSEQADPAALSEPSPTAMGRHPASTAAPPADQSQPSPSGAERQPPPPTTPAPPAEAHAGAAAARPLTSSGHEAGCSSMRVGVIGGRSAHVRVTIPLSAAMGGEIGPGAGLPDSNAPADLEGYGPIPASVARALAAGGPWARMVTDPVDRTVLEVSRDVYTPPQSMADLVRARQPECVCPSCGTSSDSCDLHHRIPWPIGATEVANLDPGCRRSHLLFTHGGWSYDFDATAQSRTWHTAAGLSYLEDSDGRLVQLRHGKTPADIARQQAEREDYDRRYAGPPPF